jgi:hypothetical protein
VDPAAVAGDDQAAGQLAVLVLIVWAGWFGGRTFARAYTFLDSLPPRAPRPDTSNEGNTLMTTTTTATAAASAGRPRPLRVVASIVGGLSALVSGLVGAGLLTGGQGGAVAGLISAAVSVLAAFGFVVAGEPKVTPLRDPVDQAGRPLLPSEATPPAEAGDLAAGGRVTP